MSKFLQRSWKALTKNKYYIASSSLQISRKAMDIACLRGVFFARYYTKSYAKRLPLFDEVWLARDRKHKILNPLESNLQVKDHKLDPDIDFKNVVVVHFMSMIRKVPFYVDEDIDKTFMAIWPSIMSSGGVTCI